MIKLKFKIDFKKGIVGKENDCYFKDFKPVCDECGCNIEQGEEYYYWYVPENYLEVGGAVPIIDSDEYILCKRCANKKR